MDWTVVALSLGAMVMGSVLIMSVLSSFVEHRKNKLALGQEDALRELVHRYEQLSETALDARQQTTSDVSELRARITSIEQSLRTVG
jgi:hypothetical protein